MDLILFYYSQRSLYILREKVFDIVNVLLEK